MLLCYAFGAPAVSSAITDSVTQTNVKVLGESPAMAMGIVYQTLANSAGIIHAQSTLNQVQQTCQYAQFPNYVDCHCIQTQFQNYSALQSVIQNCQAQINTKVLP